MTVPEIIIQKAVTGILKLIKINWEGNTDKTKTILYKLWNGVELDRYDMYTQSQAVFLKNEDDPRRLRITPSFDTEKKEIPTMHINTPSEQDGFTDSVGISPDRRGIGVDEVSGEYNKNFTRGFTGTYSIVIVSDNKTEVLLIYRTIRALLIPLFDHLQLEGLDNVKLSGKDLQLYTENVPTNLFLRAINIQASYTDTVDDIITQTNINNINFDGTAIDDSLTL